MARSHVGVAVVAAFLVLLLGFQLIDFSNYLSGPWFVEHGESARQSSSASGDQYLIGVGKADITGYASLPSSVRHHA